MTDSAPSLVVMAAGFSSRYGTNKQLDAMGPSGETLMDYSVYDAHRCGFGNVLFVIRAEDEVHFGERIARLGEFMPADCVVQRLDQLPHGHAPSPNRTKPWGTGQAVLAAERCTDGPFLLINSDDFYGRSSFALAHTHLVSSEISRKAPFAFVGFSLRNNLSHHGGVSRGVCRCDAQGLLEEIVEVRNIRESGARITGTYGEGEVKQFTGEEVVSANMWVFRPAIFPLLKSQFADFLKLEGESTEAEFLIPEAVNGIIVAGQARFEVLPARERYFGVTYQQDKPMVQQRIRELVDSGSYPANLFTR